jgi:hypothetical protein
MNRPSIILLWWFLTAAANANLTLVKVEAVTPDGEHHDYELRVTITEPCVTPSGVMVSGSHLRRSLDGEVRVALWPNDTCVPAGTLYRVDFLWDSARWSEHWSVPTSLEPVTRADVLVAKVPSRERFPWWDAVAVFLLGFLAFYCLKWLIWEQRNERISL